MAEAGGEKNYKQAPKSLLQWVPNHGLILFVSNSSCQPTIYKDWRFLTLGRNSQTEQAAHVENACADFNRQA